MKPELQRPAARVGAEEGVAMGLFDRLFGRRRAKDQLVVSDTPDLPRGFGSVPADPLHRRAKDQPVISDTPDLPHSFGYKTGWLAVRPATSLGLADALKLEGVVPCNWSTGIERAYENEGEVFITPDVNGWILAMGARSIAFIEDRAEVNRLLVDLSAHFGEAQMFQSYRVVSSYAWHRAVDGQVVRAYATVEFNEWEEGARSDAELELGITFLKEIPTDQAESDAFWARTDIAVPDEETVLKVAGLWSVNPQCLEDSGLKPSAGLLGRLPRAGV